MKFFDWNKDKNELLKSEREVSFEDVEIAFEEGKILDIIEHPNKKKYPHQKILIFEKNDYAYIVPYIEREDKYYLITIIPSRKMTKKYLKERRKK